MKTIIFDFDYTLFDAGKFKIDLANSLKNFNISQKQFLETYKKLRDNHQKEYKPLEHIKILSNITGKKESEIKKAYFKVIENCKKYLYSDSLPFLKKLQATGYKLILLTFGNIEFQKLKVGYSGTCEYFDEMYFTDKNKAHLKDKIPDNKNTIFINDNPHEIEALMKIYKNAEFILIKRTGGKKYDLKLMNIQSINNFKLVKLT